MDRDVHRAHRARVVLSIQVAVARQRGAEEAFAVVGVRVVRPLRLRLGLLGARGELRGGEPERRAGVERTDARARSARRRRRRSRGGSVVNRRLEETAPRVRARRVPKGTGRDRAPRVEREDARSARARDGEARGGEARARQGGERAGGAQSLARSSHVGAGPRDRGRVWATGARRDPHPPGTTRDANPGPGRASGGRGTREGDPGPGNAPGGRCSRRVKVPTLRSCSFFEDASATNGLFHVKSTKPIFARVSRCVSLAYVPWSIPSSSPTCMSYHSRT